MNPGRLIAEVMKELARSFADERGKLEHQWEKGDRVSTEDCVSFFGATGRSLKGSC